MEEHKGKETLMKYEDNQKNRFICL